MPVIAAVERRRELARRRDVLIGVQTVRDLVWIFLVHARQREVGESLGGMRVELDCGEDEDGRGDHRASLARDYVILTLTPSIARGKGKDLKIRCCTLRSFAVCAAQDDGSTMHVHQDPS